MTELAELHDRICLVTSCMVQQDINPADYVDDTEIEGVCRPCGGSESDEDLLDDYEALNKRIAALQMQINEKQTEAAAKVQQMREAMWREQEHLIRLSDEMNAQKRRNLSMQKIISEGITAGEAASVRRVDPVFGCVGCPVVDEKTVLCEGMTRFDFRDDSRRVKQAVDLILFYCRREKVRRCFDGEEESDGHLEVKTSSKKGSYRRTVNENSKHSRIACTSNSRNLSTVERTPGSNIAERDENPLGSSLTCVKPTRQKAPRVIPPCAAPVKHAELPCCPRPCCPSFLNKETIFPKQEQINPEVVACGKNSQDMKLCNKIKHR